MNNEERINRLLPLYLAETISSAELTELAMLAEESSDAVLHDALEAAWMVADERKAVLSNEETAAILHRILQRETNRPIVKPLIKRKWVYTTLAASVLVAGFFGIYRMASKNETATAVKETVRLQDVHAGSSKAVLILSDGRSIDLEQTDNGVLATEGADKILKSGNGIFYEQGNGKPGGYHTIQIPRGGEYYVVLADGTKVWLNSSSTIRYPTNFSDNERRLELSGEAYFEVARNEKLPFIVSIAGKGEVEVLGTHFNINAYADEDRIRTTLLEGKVKFSAATPGVEREKVSVTLSPGQQSQLFNNGKLQVARNINTDEVIAWKEGQFYFESADLKTILRQFQRWYDIDVVYEGEISGRKYFTVISRKSSLSQVLKALQANEIKYRIEGNKLIITGSS